MLLNLSTYSREPGCLVDAIGLVSDELIQGFKKVELSDDMSNLRVIEILQEAKRNEEAH